ncbi:C1 family peptidase [Streptomyces griseus]|uniref:C1 family peptidase n=1 Tax=Streptomyces griseus TaxID=1911 RepID=UPI0033C39565
MSAVGSRLVDRDYLTRLSPPWRTSARPADSSIDLAKWMPAVIDQGTVPLCTAAVATAVAGYYVRRVSHEEFTPSVLFNYRTSRRLRGDASSNGSRLEHSFQAWAESGLCAEEIWPFDPAQPDRVDRDPPQQCYDAAKRSSPVGRRLAASDGAELRDTVRGALALGIPVGVEIRLCPSLSLSFVNGGIMPVQLVGEASVGPHVVLLTGYDDAAATHPWGRDSGPGAFRVRNSWGATWGRKGYGLLPYAFLTRLLVGETWIVVEEEWEQSI